MPSASEAELLRFLSDPATYSAPGESVTVFETHGARVFLVGTRAYKLKKPVRFAYLDFSTPELRKVTLERELALNRRFAPMLYLRVLPILRTPSGALTLTGEGATVDWLLEMNRFDDEKRLDLVARRGELDDTLVSALANTVAELHRSSEPITDSRFGGAEGLERVLESNAQELRDLAGDVFDAESVHDLVAATAHDFADQRDLLNRRRAHGFVRHCHGDLHLANLCLIQERPVAFDCIEFSDDLARIDVLYDLAFLVMDLMQRGFPAQANRLFNRYHERVPLEVMADAVEGLAALPLMLSLRAAVRAHVEGRSSRHDPASRATALAYLAAARRHLHRAPAQLIAIGGLSGSGKSTLASALAPDLGGAPGALVLRSDVTRKRLAGVDPLTRLPVEAYSADMSARVYETLYSWALKGVCAGRIVIVDGVFQRVQDRDAIAGVAAQAGVPFMGLWLDVPLQTLQARVTARRGDASDADAAVLAAQAAQEVGALSWKRLEAGGELDLCLAFARAALAESPGSA